MLYTDRDLLYNTVWRSSAELNTIIQAAWAGKNIKFFDNNLREYQFNKIKDSPSKFIECIWEYDSCEVDDKKIRLYFSHKLLILSCYTLDDNLGVTGIREVNTFSMQGVMAAYDDLCKRGITIKELMDRSFDELITYQRKEDEG